MSSPSATTLACSCAVSWRPVWALSRLHPCPLSLRHLNQGNTGLYIIFHTHTTPNPKSPPSIPTSTVMTSHAPGAPSPLSPSSLLASPQDLRPPSGTSQRPIAPSLSPHPNGPASSSAFRQMTSLPSIRATTSAFPQPGACMEWSPMLALMCSEATGSAHWRSGSMTTSSSEFCVSSYLSTMCNAQTGTTKYSYMWATYKMVAGSGTEGRAYRMALWRSSTKTAAQHCRTWQMPPHALYKTNNLHMPMWTLTRSQHTLVSSGRHQSQSHSELRSHTLGSAGICACKSSTCLTRKGSSTWGPLLNGRPSAPTISSKRRSCMASFCMCHWSYFQGTPTSPAWRPCWPPSILVLSYCTPHPGTLRATLSGGSNALADLRFQYPSRSLTPSPTMKHTPMQAPVSESRSQSAQDGGHGDSLLAGSPRGETSSGPKPLASNFLLPAYVCFQARVKTLGSTGTTKGSSKDGGSTPAPTNQPTTSSATFSDYQKAVIGQYI